MNYVRRFTKRVPTHQSVPSLGVDETKSRPKNRLSSGLAYFQRPLKLRGNSSISIPLGVVLLFPCVVLVLTLVLFVRHHNANDDVLRPAGAPPAIRYAILPQFEAALIVMPCTGGSRKRMIKFSLRDV